MQPRPTRASGTTGLATLLSVLSVLTWLPLPLAAQEEGARLPGPAFTGPEPAPRLAVPAPPPEDQAESLASLLRRVLTSDPQVRVARALLQASEERRLQARSRLGPSALLSSNYGESVDKEFGSSVDRQTSRVEAGLRWNLYNAGNDQAELNASSRDVSASGQDLRRAREDSCERIAESYVELLRVQALLPRSAERLAAVHRLAAQVRQQNEAGKASDADLTQVMASEIDAEMAHQQLLADQDSAREKLATEVGTEVRSVVPVLLLPVAASALQTGTPGLVQAAQLRAQAARDRVRPAPTVMLPRIDLELRQQLSDQTTPALTTEQKRAWLITARWEFPVLGETSARRNETQRRAEAAEADAERVARSVQADLQSLRARIVNGERAVAQLDQQVQQYEALVRAGEVQFEAGRRSVAQLIGLRDSRFNAEQRHAEQVHRLLAARLRQLALTGQLLPALGLDSGSD